MMYCTQCGKELPENTAFCTACGARMMPAVGASPTHTPAFIPPQAPAYIEPASYAPVPLPMKSGLTFRNSGLGLVLIGILLIVVHIIAFSLPMFANINNIINIFRQFAVLAAIGFAVVLSMRAKGPDLSIGSVMGLSAILTASFGLSTGSIWAGLLIALIITAFIGLVNGVFSVYFRVPAVIITIITGALSYSIGLLITEGSPIMGPFPTLNDIPAAGLLLLFITFIIAFLLVLLTPLGLPKHRRDKSARPLSFIFGYVASSVIAAFAGLFMVLRLSAAMPTLGAGYEVYILFIFAVVYSIRAFDNGVAPVLFSIVPAWILCVLTNVLSLMSFPFYVQSLINGTLALIFGIMAYICRYEKQDAMLNLMSS